jgi:CelD/BcsL family acetyltransferase involved in cellulose biosynthesis
MQWKVDQCRRTGMPCCYGPEWIVKSFEELLRPGTEDFSGILFTLHFDDRLAAVEFCIRSRDVVHRLICGYDRELRQFAPGLLLSMEIVRAAESLGIRRIDFGKGQEEYKASLATASDRVVEGAVHASRLYAPTYRAWVRTKDELRSLRVVRRVQRWVLSTRLRFGYGE